MLSVVTHKRGAAMLHHSSICYSALCNMGLAIKCHFQNNIALLSKGVHDTAVLLLCPDTVWLTVCAAVSVPDVRGGAVLLL